MLLSGDLLHSISCYSRLHGPDAVELPTLASPCGERVGALHIPVTVDLERRSGRLVGSR